MYSLIRIDMDGPRSFVPLVLLLSVTEATVATICGLSVKEKLMYLSLGYYKR